MKIVRYTVTGICKARRAEPKEDIRGNIARTYFYFEATYGMKISKQEKQLFEAWDKLDPVDAWEIERNKRIKKIQGAENKNKSVKK
ncbi:MAG: endonuclease [Arcobacteraceae bacterium]